MITQGFLNRYKFPLEKYRNFISNRYVAICELDSGGGAVHHCGHRTRVVLTGHLQQCLSHRTRAVLSSVQALHASACHCWALLQSYAPPPESSLQMLIFSFHPGFVMSLFWPLHQFLQLVCTKSFVRKIKAAISNLFSVLLCQFQ